MSVRKRCPSTHAHIYMHTRTRTHTRAHKHARTPSNRINLWRGCCTHARCSILQCAAVGGSVLKCFEACCSALYCVAAYGGGASLHTHTCVCIHAQTYTQTRTHTDAHTHQHTHTHTRGRAHTHTVMHTCTHSIDTPAAVSEQAGLYSCVDSLRSPQHTLQHTVHLATHSTSKAVFMCRFCKVCNTHCSTLQHPATDTNKHDYMHI